MVEFGVLGLLEVRGDGGEVVELRGRKVKAVLAMLLLEPGRVVSADHLVEALWGDDPPPSAAATLQVYVSQLRKVLGRGAIQTRAPGYVLAVEPDRIDARRLERLVGQGRAALATDPARARALFTDALALWRGPALADFAFDDFARAEAARLDELRMVAIEERAEADLALGRHGEVVTALRPVLDEHPLRERLWAQFILALYRGGRQADALRAGAEVRRVLRDELGIEPGPVLRRLEADVLAQAPHLAPLLPDGPSPAPVATRAPAVPAYVEIVGAGPPELFPLDRPRVTIGRGQGNDVCLRTDRLVSEMHAVIEFYGASFTVRDLGSSNGTFLNGRRLTAERALHSGDRIELGRTVVRFTSSPAMPVLRTDRSPSPPALSDEERQVVRALCRPLLTAGPAAEPAGIAEVAQALGVDESVVKFHLADLYDKFGIQDGVQSRRVALAEEAVLRRVVTPADLR